MQPHAIEEKMAGGTVPSIDPADLIAELEGSGITLWVEDQRLRYKAPQGGLTPELRQRLVDNKDRLLTLLAHRQGDQRASRLQAIPRGAADKPRPLSFAQEQLWFLAQMLPGNPAYNMYRAYRLDGPLDSAALRRGLDEIVRRHDALRTVFVNVGGRPLQRVSEPGALTLPVIDLGREHDAGAPLQVLLGQEAERAFDLTQGPLFRARLYRVDVDSHALLLVMHHIVSDGWSIDILLRELGNLYDAFSARRGSSLPALPIQYADFAEWQRDGFQAEVLQAQINYWKEALNGAPTLLELPTDHPRPPAQTYRGAIETVLFPRSLVAAMEELSRAEGASVFMTLLAAFQALLGRCSGQDDILVGTPGSGRNRPEVEDVIGYFVNMLVLRADLSGNPTFRELLRRVRDVALAAYRNQDVPFEKLVAELRPERNPSHNPLFQVSFALNYTPPPAPRLGSLRTRSEPVASGTSIFDLSIEMTVGSEGLAVAAEYSTDLFGRGTIQRLLDYFRVLLESIAADPDRPIMELPLLSETARHQLLVQWNDTAADVPSQLLHESFEAQATRTPERYAVRSGTMQWSYAELEQRANRIAGALRARGAGRGTRIGLCLERGAQGLAAVFGVLKTGAAYVPLDPAFPETRLRFMVEDAQLALLVSTAELAARCGVPRERQLLLDADAEFIAAAPSSRLARDAVSTGPGDPAYIIYTSGSTGQPKGVVVPHSAVINFLASMAQQPGLGPDDVLVAVTTLSFDIAVLELLLPLTVGATVVIASRDQAGDGVVLGALLDQHRATVMQATPVTWRLLLDAGWGGRTPFKALAGGEALPMDVADALIERGVELWNLYGPTETTVWSTCARITDTTGGITIGRPIANTTVRILDAHDNLCPIGIPGELCIGGAGLAVGYWNRPALTAERFVPDPFDAQGQGRLYRTGDRARWRPDGTLEHLGRLDDQIKLRGYRIEPGEIEAGIARHPAVREVVVLVPDDIHGDKRLIAYVVAEPKSDELVDQLRRSLRSSLPEYMVPVQFMILDAFPRTPNGKLDRKALPAPDSRRLSGSRSSAAPRAPTEKAIAEIWSAVLGIDGFGIDDNFFDLGGHSLLLLQTHSRIRASLRADLPVVSLFQYPTIRTLAQHLAGATEPVLASQAADRAGKQRDALRRQRKIMGAF